MGALGALGFFNIIVLLAPPGIINDVLTLMDVPYNGRIYLAIVVVINVAVSLAFEQWGAQKLGTSLGRAHKWWKGRRRIKDGNAYKSVGGD